MPIPERFLDELNDRLNIVEVVSAYVPLTKKGANYWGLCPFHHEKTPSFSVNAEKQIFHCFGCGKGGGAIRFLMEMENLSFPDAVRKLAGQEGMEVPEDDPSGGRRRERRARILELNKEAARFYRTMLSDPRGAAVAAYIAEARRISPKYSARFGLGAAPEGWDNLIRAMADKGYDKAELLEAGLAVSGKNGGIYDKFRNRLMLPVIDVRGDVIGFTSRVMDDSAPKYLNTPETSVFKKRSVLYGVNYAKSSKRPNFILVEGNIDVISMHQAGFDNTVATMGTALTEEHIRLISRYTKELVLCLDNDAAGEDATQRALALLRGSDLEVKVLRLPQKRGEDGTLGKQDPDDYIKRYGGQAFEALMNRSENSVEYRLGQVQGKYDLEKDDQRSAYLQEAAGLIGRAVKSGGTGNLRRPGGGCRPHLPRGHGPGGGAPAPAEKLAGPAQTGTAGPGPGPAAPAQGAGLAIQQSAFRQGGRRHPSGGVAGRSLFPSAGQPGRRAFFLPRTGESLLPAAAAVAGGPSGHLGGAGGDRGVFSPGNGLIVRYCPAASAPAYSPGGLRG